MEPDPRVRRSFSVERVGLLLIAIAVGWFYLWTATSAGKKLSLEVEGLDFYNLLVDGFLDGHLYLNYEGDPGIAKLKDPYDPAQNGPYRVLDMSYYHGRYYIYFGPTPALVLLLPWKVLTGVHLPSHLAAVVFAIGGYFTLLALLLRLRRWHFPKTPSAAVWIGALILGLGTMVPALLRRPAVYELAIACSFFFITLSFWALHRAITVEGKRNLFLALASASYGLALVARPTNLYGSVIFAATLLWLWNKRVEQERWLPPPWLRNAFAAAVPFGLIFAGMLLYNYLRFDNPFEFGQIYQLTSKDMGRVKAFSWSYLPFNAYIYFIAPAQYTYFFPFFLPAILPAMPVGYDGLDDLYGLLPSLPVVLLAFAVPFGCVGRKGNNIETLRLFAVLLLLAFMGVLAVFLFFSGATIRYYTDFLPGLMLLVCIGLFSLEQATSARRWGRRAMRVFAWPTVLISLAFSVMVSFQHGGLLRAVNPVAWAHLAEPFNYGTHLYDRIAGVHYGPMRVEIKFPKDRRGRFEPLLVSGCWPLVDYLWVLYDDESHLRIGYEHTNAGGAATQPILVDYDKVHTLELEVGFLYPPEAHPHFVGQTPAEIAAQAPALRVVLDGVPYLDTRASFYDAVSPSITFGLNDVGIDSFGHRFTGQIMKVERVALKPTLNAKVGYGPVEMAVIFPEHPSNKYEPLVVTGETGRGDIFYVTYLDNAHVRFTLDHWGIGAVSSAPIEIVPGYIQQIEISLGSLYPESEKAMKNRLVVRFNGVTIMDEMTSFHPATKESQTFGFNLIGGSNCGPNFTGKIVSLKRRKTW